MSWLRSARTATGDLVNVEIVDGLIGQVLPATGPTDSGQTGRGQTDSGTAGATGPGDVDLSGQVLLPSFVEPHAHLDKALTASLGRNLTGDLAGAIAAMDLLRELTTPADIIARAEAALRIHLAYGTTHIRSHVNVLSDVGLSGLEAMVEVRERWRGVIDL